MPIRPRLMALAGACAAMLAACGDRQGPPAPSPPEVAVIVAQPATVPLEKELVGRLAAFRSADVRARVPGVLQQRSYREGSDVEEGAILFVIDPAPYRAALGSAQAALAQAEANAANARASAGRARRLAPGSFISGADLDNALAAERSAVAAVQAARASVESARINLGYATVRAPISGRAGKQQVTEGALVGQGSTTLLTTVDQVDPLYVNFSMSLAEFDQVRRLRLDRSAPTTVRVMLQDGSVYAHAGELDFSGDVVDPATGAVSLRALLPNPERMLLPGAYVTLQATLGRQEGMFLVPQAAVQRDASGAYLLVVGADDVVVRRNVVTDRADAGRWVIGHGQGLEAGDRVIVSGVQKARPGAPATAVPWQPGDGAAPASDGAAAPEAGEAAEARGAPAEPGAGD
ncbi:efflux RND transporter periplasmic adaptor subunit [Luteimonas sp. SJ-92]|uniref:Efflux RND transporter periplasmic adaptor subunit n=1 Tax=Luteimonas salinisoli TaxID=2752307 RepID=A0A853JA48_9GAMM|nr:efflux RND transporter periplasmic adaptor subunit [Luteimonas salinisoli]NZA25549.1 efflux RND transporter periplasmic adaptor subunit [Luteimonas salinisoli]